MKSLLLRILSVAIFVIASLGLASTAYAYNETTTNPPPPSTPATMGHGGFVGYAWQCDQCHGGFAETGGWCGACHRNYPGQTSGHGMGPHGTYLSSGAPWTGGATSRCRLCHTLHDAPSGFNLLPRETVTDTCFTCHDGTAGYGVYGALAARGVAVGGAHHVDATNVVPGGDPATGGSATGSFGGVGGTLSCDDCHSPHNSKTVALFVGDRQRTTLAWQKTSMRRHVTTSSKLLKQKPGNATTSVATYGSDWCAACHAGRMSGGVVHNHPVDSLMATSTPFNYSNAAILATDGPTTQTVLGMVGGWNRPPYPYQDPAVYPENRGFLMPYPRTSQQAGHSPICQQCHEDSRNVGSLSATGLADATKFTITSEDGSVTADNPRFQNFPHETANARMLVEQNDDLCLNCHPTDILP